MRRIPLRFDISNRATVTNGRDLPVAILADITTCFHVDIMDEIWSTE